MHDRSLQDVRKKLVQLMRLDPPPPHAMPGAGARDGRLLDRWVAARFSPEELQALFRLETVYGERALTEWFTEAAFEASVRPSSAH